MELAQYATGTDALRQKLQANTGVTGGNLRTTATGLQAAPAPAAGPQAAVPVTAPPAAPAAPPAGPPPPEGMSPQDWANFQARYPQPGAPAPAGTGAPGAGSGAVPAASTNPLGDVFRTALVSRLNATAAPTSIADDPVLAAQSGAMRQASARQAARDRSAGVEAAGAQGLESSGATSGMIRKLGQDRALHEGQADAQLLGDARGQRMQELQAFLGIAGNTLSNEERNLLDREMGQLDASVRREGIASQTALGQGDLSLRGELGRGGLNQNLLSILLNNRTDNDRTALQGAGLELGANTAALQAMLGR